MKTKSKARKSVIVVNYSDLTAKVVSNRDMFKSLSKGDVEPVELHEYPGGLNVAKITNEPNGCMFRFRDIKYITKHGGILLPSGVSLQELTDINRLPAGLFWQDVQREGCDTRTRNIDGTERTDTDRRDCVNGLLLANFEASEYGVVAAIVGNKAVPHIIGDDWKNEDTLRTYRYMVNMIDDSETPIVFDPVRRCFVFEA